MVADDRAIKGKGVGREGEKGEKGGCGWCDCACRDGFLYCIVPPLFPSAPFARRLGINTFVEVLDRHGEEMTDGPQGCNSGQKPHTRGRTHQALQHDGVSSSSHPL